MFIRVCVSFEFNSALLSFLLLFLLTSAKSCCVSRCGGDDADEERI